MPHLFAVFVKVNFERRIFSSESVQCPGEVRCFLPFGFDSQRYDRLRYMHRCLPLSIRSKCHTEKISLTMVKLVDPSVKVSPEEHSTPKVAQISPGPIELIS
jgi:hypothetical protein